ncbi:MAG: asparagine synthetase B, partial [Bacteroidetes bacterium]|nr:asparagine synthetase B [Bacteroidota bacterium]
MCGINGFVNLSLKNSNTQESCISQMNSSILHRGPDHSGVYISGDNTVILGMQRLSIIDISAGSQPMYSESKQIIIVFNGEIYNYKEIRDLLKSEFGSNFSTNSDTEVILRGYEAWGKDIFSYLNGMFAISIYDARANKLLLARDRTGEKPLYYYPKHDLFA